MDARNLALEWTDTTQHWLVEVPIRLAAYLSVVLLVRYLLHRMIDRATTRRSGKSSVEERPPQDTKPTLLRRLRPDVPVTTISDQAGTRRKQRAHTIGSVLKSTVSIILLSWLVLAALNVVGGVNLAPFIASAGVIGLAIGFGAQNLVRDFVSGVFMLLEDQYGGVGDVVDLGEMSGEVESVGLRITTVRDIDGTLCTSVMGRSPASAT